MERYVRITLPNSEEAISKVMVEGDELLAVEKIYHRLEVMGFKREWVSFLSEREFRTAEFKMILSYPDIEDMLKRGEYGFRVHYN